MMKRIFALASVSALGGLTAAASAAGCSSDEAAGSRPTDAGIDVKRGKEAGPAVDPTEAGDLESCLSTDPIDATRFPYAKAVKSAGACTEDDLKAISAFFEEKTNAGDEVLVSEWSKEVSEQCSKCAFTTSDAAEWGPILVKDDRLENVNRGGCIEVLSGSEACGRAYQQVTECRLEACIAKCKTQDEFTACLQDAEGIFDGPCKESYDLMDEDCGAMLGAYETGCRGTDWTFEGPVKVQCITGGAAGDAGDDD